jgi:hypothetical protein
MRHIAIFSIVTTALIVSGCSNTGAEVQSAETPVANTSAPSATPSQSPIPEMSETPTVVISEAMTIEQAGEYYLDWVCWSNKSLNRFGDATNDKSNSELLKDSLKSTIRRTAKVQRETALALDAPLQEWPDVVAKPVGGVVDSLLIDVSSLNSLADARNATDVAFARQDLAKSGNASAQKVRLRLGLPSADSRQDGCEGRGSDPRVVASASPRAAES